MRRDVAVTVAGLFQMSRISDILDSLGINVPVPTLPPAMAHMAQSAGDDDDDSR